MVLLLGLTACSSQAAPESVSGVLTGRFVPTAQADALDGKVVVTTRGCAGLHNAADEKTYLILWPAGTVLSTENASQIDLPDGSIRIGDKIAPATGVIINSSEISSANRGEYSGTDCIVQENEKIVVLTGLKDFLFAQ